MNRVEGLIQNGLGYVDRVSPVDRVLRMPSEMSQVAIARRFVSDGLAAVSGAGGDVPVATGMQLALIASELVTNAIEHGADDVVILRLCVDAGGAVVSVSVGAPDSRIGEVATWRLAPADHPAGRGLAIVRALADNVVVEHIEGAPHVTARVAFESPSLAG